MGKWIKENLVLVSGILLPVLLVGGFFILNRLPGLMADPPTHDFLLIAFRNSYQNPQQTYYLDFEVRDGKLSGRVAPTDENHQHYNRQNAGIFLYRADRNIFEEIVFDLPDGLDQLAAPVALNLAVTDHLELNKRQQSPDGYQFEFMGYRGHGGVLGELFGMGRRYENSYVLKKGDHFFELPEVLSDINLYQNDLQFMGWVVEDSKL